MTDRWRRIEELFDTAMELDPDQRAAFLDQACADDPSLRQEVEELIAHRDEASDLLDGLIGEAVQGVVDEASTLAVDQPIGNYKIERELGQGGMGRVYLGARADEQFRKQVAIKVIKRGMDTDEIMRRFRHERQILANLDHPNIARLLDGGTTDDGVPYLVMEYIEGEPIDQYCDRHRLSIDERLKLFRTVCEAVQYSHNNLVVHRDLKPSNILVMSDGVPKLLDFGIAKLLDPEASLQTRGETGEGLRLMTPEYASPEQAQGGPITTASDVYSLGVVLYQLLTGRRPYSFDGCPPHEIARVISHVEPEKPSDSQLLRGDLDNIVLMALRKEPEERYASVKQFSEDIGRYQEGFPVIARNVTLGYRAGKFIRRHWVGVGMAATFLLLIIGFGVDRWIQSVQLVEAERRAMEEARRARIEAETATQVSEFLVDMFKVSDPWSESQVKDTTAREILDGGAKKIASELDDQPVVQSRLMETIGRVYLNLGLYDGAEPLLKGALDIRQRSLGLEHADVASSLDGLGILLFHKGQYDESERLLRQALTMRRKLVPEQSEVAVSLTSLATVLQARGKVDEAGALFQEALALQRKLRGQEHRDIVASLNNLAVLLRSRGDFKAAEPLFREALEIARRLIGENNPDIAGFINNLAGVLLENGNDEEAELLFREALEIHRQILGPEHPRVLLNMNNLALLLQDKGDYEEAEPLFREALMIRRRTLGQEHPQVAFSLNNLALLLLNKGDYGEAESLLNEALEMQRKLLGREHLAVAMTLNNLADVLNAQGKRQLAESRFREALAMRRKTLPARHPHIAYSLVGLGQFLADRGDLKDAEPLLREGVTIWQKALPPSHWWNAMAKSALGACLVGLQRYDEAEPLLLESHQAFKDKFGELNKRTQQTQNRIVGLYQAWGKPEKAAQYRARQP